MNYHFKLAAAISVCVLICQSLFAWGANHTLIGRSAYAVLPPWQQAVWGPADKDDATVGKVYSLLTDMATGIPDAAPTDTSLAPYCMTNVNLHGPNSSRQENLAIISHYYETSINLLRQTNTQEAAKYAGAFAHFLQDCSCPGHALVGGTALIATLVPQPEEKLIPTHIPIDGVRADRKALIQIKPELLGTSIPEAVYRTGIALDAMLVQVDGRVIPVHQAFLAGDQERVQKLCQECAALGHHLVASVWYTILSIAFQRFEPGDAKKTEVFDLTEMEYYPLYKETEKSYPEYWVVSGDYPGGYYYLVKNYIYAGHEQLAPLTMNVKKASTLFPKGWSMSRAGKEARLLFPAEPPGVYKEFRATIGVWDKSDKSSKVRFAVMEGTWGNQVYASPLLSNQDEPLEIKVPLKGSPRLILTVKTMEGPTAVGIWANPVMLKNQK